MARKLSVNQKRYAVAVSQMDCPLSDDKLFHAYQQAYQTKNMELVAKKVKEFKKIPLLQEYITKLREGKVGRPTSYKEEYCEKIIDFFNRPPFEAHTVKNDEGEDVPAMAPSGHPIMIPCQLPTLEAFSLEIGVHVNTLLNWQNKHKEFLCAVQQAKAIQKNILVQCGLFKLYDARFATLVATNMTDMTEQKEVKVATYEIPKDATDEEASREYEKLLKGG